MSETSNNVNVENSEVCDPASIGFITGNSDSRKCFWFSSDSSDGSNKNVEANTLTGRKRNLQKCKRIKGLSYKTRSGILKPAKTFRDTICGCRLKCNEKILSDEREAAMKAFYNLPSSLCQNIFLKGCIKAKEIKRRRPTNKTKKAREHSFTYYFRKDKYDIPICKKYFRDTYQVSDGRIYRCCSEVTSLVEQQKDCAAGNKTKDINVKKHLNSFPTYSSHYTKAQNTKRQSLNPDSNVKVNMSKVRKMYNLYVKQCGRKNAVPVKEKSLLQTT